MKKIIIPVAMTSAAIFIASCDNDNNANEEQHVVTWRLSGINWKFMEGDELCVVKNSTRYLYDESNEYSERNEKSLNPYLSFSDCEQYNLNDPQLSGTRVKTEIVNLSASHWREETSWYEIAENTTSQEPEWIPTTTIEFLNFGDHKRTSIGDWSGVDTSKFDEFFFDPLAGLDGDAPYIPPSEISDSELTTNSDSDLFPKPHIIREYNNSGYLTYRAIYTHDQSQLISEDILDYRNGATLFKITMHINETPRIEQWADDFVTSDQERILTYVHDFNFISEHQMEIVTRVSINGNTVEQHTKTANYEQAPCGPITLERSKKAVPVEFPICIQK